MVEIDNLELGCVIDNYQLMSIFKCAGQGGMRRSLKTKTLVLILNHVNSIYDDRWQDDILYYTGMGTEGDQSFTKAQNKTLYNYRNEGIKVFLFEVFVEKKYKFRGEVELAEEPFMENQLDKKNEMRKVCIFPVKTINNIEITIDNNTLNKNFDLKEKKTKKLDDTTLHSLAQQGSTNPRKINVKSNQYIRSAAVNEYAKRLANGICQLCNTDAPFLNKKKEPYLEVHHVTWLSEGGSDTINNVVALCPNCHKKMHIVDNKEDKEYLTRISLNN